MNGVRGHGVKGQRTSGSEGPGRSRVKGGQRGQWGSKGKVTGGGVVMGLNGNRCGYWWGCGVRGHGVKGQGSRGGRGVNPGVVGPRVIGVKGKGYGMRDGDGVESESVEVWG